jgi:2-polyprenyl-6-methoxyphenol hydroxylase-like FAD-dependent oxidoreductase
VDGAPQQTARAPARGEYAGAEWRWHQHGLEEAGVEQGAQQLRTDGGGTGPALIAGAGPCGLAAALMLLDRGWTEITLVEQRRSAGEFDRGRAFNYQLDGRGQLILEELGFTKADLARHGLPNDSFRQVTFAPDGSSRRFDFPALLPGRKTPYWMTRAHLLSLLQDALDQRNSEGRVTLLYDHRLARLERDGNGTLQAVLSGPDGIERSLAPRLLLGCDGLKSQVRESLAEIFSAADRADETRDFRRTALPSPSAELRYKVLTFPPRFSVAGSQEGVSDHRLAYCFLSTYRNRRERMALFALPVPGPEEPRNINIILHRSHRFWELDSAEAVLDFLRRGFPQLDFDRIVDARELAAFASLEATGFPQPQYANSIHAAVGAREHSQDCLLLGDAAHAFPPDLGMGVNSALEEVFILKRLLDTQRENVSRACQAFARRRLPENRSLVRLVQRVHPYQYNQVPWRLKAWFLKFMLQRSLTRVTRGAIPAPGFVLSQKHRMNFSTMERQYLRAELGFRVVMAAVLELLAALAVVAVGG